MSLRDTQHAMRDSLCVRAFSCLLWDGYAGADKSGFQGSQHAPDFVIPFFVCVFVCFGKGSQAMISPVFKVHIRHAPKHIPDDIHVRVFVSCNKGYVRSHVGHYFSGRSAVRAVS